MCLSKFLKKSLKKCLIDKICALGPLWTLITLKTCRFLRVKKHQTEWTNIRQ